MTENQKKPPPLHIPSFRWLPPKGECGDEKGEEMANDGGRMTRVMW